LSIGKGVHFIKENCHIREFFPEGPYIAMKKMFTGWKIFYTAIEVGRLSPDSVAGCRILAGGCGKERV
jgi:hypothetical protein